MYQLLQDALPYLFAFYGIDGLVLVRIGQLLLVRTWRTCRTRRDGLQLAGLWPFSEAVRTYDPPVLVTAAGFYVARTSDALPVPRREDLVFHAFESEAPAERDGRKVVYGKRTVLKAPSEAAAESAARMLCIAGAASAGGRIEALRGWLTTAGDLARLRARRGRHEERARPIRILALLLFTATFVVVPIFLLVGSGTAVLALALLAILVVHVLLVLATRRALRHCEHAAPSSVIVSMALFPPAAMRAALAVAMDLYADFHPVAVAAVFLPPEAFEDLVRRERHRLEVAVESARGGDLEGFWRARLDAVDAIAAAAKADIARVRTSPVRMDAAAAAYCPLCFTEYRSGFEACSDCATPLRPFAST